MGRRIANDPNLPLPGLACWGGRKRYRSGKAEDFSLLTHKSKCMKSSHYDRQASYSIARVLILLKLVIPRNLKNLQKFSFFFEVRNWMPVSFKCQNGSLNEWKQYRSRSRSRGSRRRTNDVVRWRIATIGEKAFTTRILGCSLCRRAFRMFRVDFIPAESVISLSGSSKGSKTFSKSTAQLC